MPTVDAAAGDVAEGKQLFTDNCAGCHQVVAQGGYNCTNNFFATVEADFPYTTYL